MKVSIHDFDRVYGRMQQRFFDGYFDAFFFNYFFFPYFAYVWLCARKWLESSLSTDRE